MARQAKFALTKSFEQRLEKRADALHGDQEPSKSEHVVFGLLFRNDTSARFEEQRGAIEISLSKLTTACAANGRERVMMW